MGGWRVCLLPTWSWGRSICPLTVIDVLFCCITNVVLLRDGDENMYEPCTLASGVRTRKLFIVSSLVNPTTSVEGIGVLRMMPLTTM